jgi:hypothetical protein
MSKKAKAQNVPAPAAVVEAAVELAPVVLTKRNRVPTSTVLVRTDKKLSDRSDHTKLAWAVVEATLPATASALIEALEAAKFDEKTKAKLVSFSAYISYMIRRKALAPKAE